MADNESTKIIQKMTAKESEIALRDKQIAALNNRIIHLEKEIKNIHLEYREDKEKLRDFEARNLSLFENNQHLLVANEKLNSNLDAAVKEQVDIKNDEIDKLGKELSALKKDYKNLEKENKSLIKELEIEKECHHKVQNEFSKQEALLADQRQEIENFQKMALEKVVVDEKPPQEWIEKVEELEAQIDSKNNEIKKFRTKINNLENLVNEKENIINNIGNDLDELKQKLANQEQDFKNNYKMKMEKKLNDINRRHAEENAEHLSRIEAAEQDATQRLNEKINELESLHKKQLKNKEKQILKFHDDIKFISDTNNEQIQELEKKILGLSNSLQKKKDSKMLLKQQLNDLKNKCTLRDSELDKYKKIIENYESSIEADMQGHAELKETLDLCQTQIKEKNAELAKFFHENKLKDKKIQELNILLQEKFQECAKIQDSFENVLKSYEEAKKKMAYLQKEVISGLKNSIYELQTEVNLLREMVKSNKSILKIKEFDVLKLKKRVSSLEKKLQSSNMTPEINQRYNPTNKKLIQESKFLKGVQQTKKVVKSQPLPIHKPKKNNSLPPLESSAQFHQKIEQAKSILQEQRMKNIEQLKVMSLDQREEEFAMRPWLKKSSILNANNSFKTPQGSPSTSPRIIVSKNFFANEPAEEPTDGVIMKIKDFTEIEPPRRKKKEENNIFRYPSHQQTSDKKYSPNKISTIKQKSLDYFEGEEKKKEIARLNQMQKEFEETPVYVGIRKTPLSANKNPFQGYKPHSLIGKTREPSKFKIGNQEQLIYNESVASQISQEYAENDIQPFNKISYFTSV